MTNYARYIGLLLETFPELRAAVGRQEGIYCRTREFVDFVNAAIVAGDWATVAKSYAFVERILDSEPDDDVRNAIGVSFIEHLDFHSHPANGPTAKKRLSPRLLAEWKELESCWEEYARATGLKPKKPTTAERSRKRATRGTGIRQRGKRQK
jgi:hypothetical protein